MNKKRLLVVVPLAGLVIFAVVASARIALAQARVARDAEALAAATPVVLGETATLEILPLYEGVASDPSLSSGLGVSYLVKTDSATILLDVGNNPAGASPSPLERNMAALGLSLDDVDIIVISHTHFDHMGGRGWAGKGTFGIAATDQTPLGDRPVYVPEPVSYPGSAPVIVTAARKIAEGVGLTGTIAYRQPLPIALALPGGVEQAVVINLKGRGGVVITGCGHMGLPSLVAHAEKEFALPVVGVVGGLHKGRAGAEALQGEIRLLDGLKPVVVAVSPHDTGAAGVAAFREAFPAVYRNLQVGTAVTVQ